MTPAPASRPLLILDVDGVLRPITRAEEDGLERITVEGAPFSDQVAFRPAVIAELNAIINQGLAVAVLCTSWEARAIDLARRIGLRGVTRSLPGAAVGLTKISWPEQWGKSRAVTAATVDRDYVWVDDDLTRPVAEWHEARADRGRFAYIAPTWEVGLTVADVAVIRETLEAWREGKTVAPDLANRPIEPAPAQRPALDLSDVTKLVVAGDWHGNTRWIRSAIEFAASKGIATVIHVGDLALGLPGSESTIRVMEQACHKTGMQVLVSPGNHDNWDLLDRRERDLAGMVYLSRHVRALPRGHVWTMGSRTFGALGGAVSVDRDDRRGTGTWWPQEAPTPDEAKALIAACNGDLDVLVTHDVPAAVEMRSWINLDRWLGAETQAVRDLLQHVVDETRPTLAFAGHWHQRVAARIGSTTSHTLAADGQTGNLILLDLEMMTVTGFEEEGF